MNTTNQEVYSRINDFIEFHNESCKADTIVGVLKEYLNLINATKTQKENATLFYALTYSVPSTVILLENYDKFIENPENFYEENKNKLIFQSDRKYVKANNAFVRSFFDFKNKKVFEYFNDKTILDIEDSVKKIEEVYFFSRFSAFLFLECYCCIFDKKTVNTKLDWLNGSTVTSGMLNVLHRDNEANLWDKEHKLLINTQTLDEVADNLLSMATEGKELAVLETNLCAYRKLFKGSRYLGYYADRVLEEIYKTQSNYNIHSKAITLLFKARENIIPIKYLGEKNNWLGIRKDMKKLYQKKGVWKW